MANYIFEQMTDAQAASYSAASDSLYFLTGSASTLQVKFTPATGLQVDALTLSNGTNTHTFAAAALGGEPLTFFSGSSDQSTLAFGLNTAVADTVSGVAGSTARFYGLGGNDTITGSLATDSIYGGEGNDTINGAHGTSDASLSGEADFLAGGNGADSITGTVGNDHIYGNSNDSGAGAADGADTLIGGAGQDYIQGNAGADSIDGGLGNDRLYGGADNDTILGNDGNDYLQGNKGDDQLNGGNGVDELHGGAGADSLTGGIGNDILFGDLGNDTLVGGAGYDAHTGGAGADVFTFAAGDADIVDVQATDGNNFTDSVLDFNSADGDTLNLSIATGGDVLVDDTGTVYTTVDGALQGANGLFAGAAATTDIVALQVGADTYLFWSDSGSTTEVNEVLRLANTTASDVDTTWFS